MNGKNKRFAETLAVLISTLSTILIIVSLATTCWFWHNDSEYGLFRRCWTSSTRHRKCKDLSGGIAEKTASIALFVALFLHVISAAVMLIGICEKKIIYFKYACVICILAGISVLSGVGAYGILASEYAGPKFRYSFYVAVTAILSSFVSSIMAFIASRRRVNPSTVFT